MNRPDLLGLTAPITNQDVRVIAAFLREGEVTVEERQQIADLLDPPPPHITLHERLKNTIANVYIDSHPDTPANILARRAAANALTLIEGAVTDLQCANCSHPTDASADGCYVAVYRQKVLDLLGERMD